MGLEQELVDGLRHKDEHALKELMDTYGNEILRTAFLLTRDRHLAEDISQETFLNAYQNIAQFRGTGTLKGWLLTIALNLCRERMRRAGWRKLFFRDILDYEAISPDGSPEQQSINGSLIEQIQDLPYKYREVLVLFYYQGFTIREISEQLHEKEGTIKSKLSRGREKLRNMLEEGEWIDAPSR